MSNFKEQSPSMPVPSNSDRLIGLHHRNKLCKKLRVRATLLSFLFCLTVFAQQEKVDSLKKILPSLRDNATIEHLSEARERYMRLL